MQDSDAGGGGPEEAGEDLPVPLVCHFLVGGVLLYLAYSVFIGDPPWPSIIYEEQC